MSHRRCWGTGRIPRTRCREAAGELVRPQQSCGSLRGLRCNPVGARYLSFQDLGSPARAALRGVPQSNLRKRWSLQTLSSTLRGKARPRGPSSDREKCWSDAGSPSAGAICGHPRSLSRVGGTRPFTAVARESPLPGEIAVEDVLSREALAPNALKPASGKK